MKSGGKGGKMNKIERAHQMYRDGKYEEALRFYTEALSIAKFNPQKIVLNSNRAACFLKLHHFKKAADECTSVLELDHNHTGALMLRAQTLVTLKEYHSALFDVNRLIELNPSSEVYQNLEARLKTQLEMESWSVGCNKLGYWELEKDESNPPSGGFNQGKSLAPIPEAETELEEEDEESGEDVEELEENEEDGKEDHEDEEGNEDDKYVSISTGRNQIEEPKMLSDPAAEVSTQTIDDHKAERRITTVEKESPEQWKAIPKPKGHSRLDYSRWDRVEDDSSDDEDADDEEESQPHYRFRVRTVGVRQVK